MDDTDDLFRWTRLSASLAGRERVHTTRRVNRRGHTLERWFSTRLGYKAVSKAAFDMLFPGVSFRDDTNRGAGSLGLGTGSPNIDAIDPIVGALAGGYALQIKNLEAFDEEGNPRDDHSEVSVVTGNLSTLETTCGHYRGRWRAHGRSLPVLLIKSDWREGMDPEATKVIAFAVVNLSALVRQNHRFASVVSDRYEWSEALGAHVSTGTWKGRGKNMQFPLYVRLKAASKANKTTKHYHALCLSLSYLRKHGMLDWVDTTGFTSEEVNACIKSAVRTVARSR